MPIIKHVQFSSNDVFLLPFLTFYLQSLKKRGIFFFMFWNLRSLLRQYGAQFIVFLLIFLLPLPPIIFVEEISSPSCSTTYLCGKLTFDFSKEIVHFLSAVFVYRRANRPNQWEQEPQLDHARVAVFMWMNLKIRKKEKAWACKLKFREFQVPPSITEQSEAKQHNFRHPIENC